MAESDTQLPNADKVRFDYAWKWFVYHADQRMKMFNFMLIVLGVFANAIVTAVKDDILPVAAALCVVAAVLAVAFGKLDLRNQTLTWAGENVLAHLECTWLFSPPQDPIPTLHEKNKKKKVVYGILRQLNTDPDLATPAGIRGSVKSACLGQHRFWIKGTAYLMAWVFSGSAILLIYYAVRGHGPPTGRLELKLDHVSTDKLQLTVEPANSAASISTPSPSTARTSTAPSTTLPLPSITPPPTGIPVPPSPATLPTTPPATPLPAPATDNSKP